MRTFSPKQKPGTRLRPWVIARRTKPLRSASTSCVVVEPPSVSIISFSPPGSSMIFSPRWMARTSTDLEASRQPQHRENSRTPGM